MGIENISLAMLAFYGQQSAIQPINQPEIASLVSCQPGQVVEYVSVGADGNISFTYCPGQELSVSAFQALLDEHFDTWDLGQGYQLRNPVATTNNGGAVTGVYAQEGLILVRVDTQTDERLADTYLSPEEVVTILNAHTTFIPTQELTFDPPKSQKPPSDTKKETVPTDPWLYVTVAGLVSAFFGGSYLVSNADERRRRAEKLFSRNMQEKNSAELLRASKAKIEGELRKSINYVLHNGFDEVHDEIWSLKQQIGNITSEIADTQWYAGLYNKDPDTYDKVPALKVELESARQRLGELHYINKHRGAFLKYWLNGELLAVKVDVKVPPSEKSYWNPKKPDQFQQLLTIYTAAGQVEEKLVAENERKMRL